MAWLNIGNATPFHQLGAYQLFQRGSISHHFIHLSLGNFQPIGPKRGRVLVFTLRGGDVDPASRSIVIDREQQAQIALVFERTMNRPPTDAELDAQIERFIRDEVLYREALRLGLDQGDAVVRRRMAQKMDILASSALS